MAKETGDSKGKISSVYTLEGVPPIKEALPLSLQHVIAAIVGMVTPAIMVANVCNLSEGDKTLLIQTSLIFSAIATIIQLFPIFGKIGSRLPIVMGASFAYVPILTAIGADFNIAAIFGAQIAGGIASILVGVFIKWIRKLFPPLVTGTVIFSIGLSLYPVAVKYMAGGAGQPGFGSWQNWVVALVTMVIALFFSYFTKGSLKLSGMLIAIVVGYLLAIPLGLVNTAPVGTAGWFEPVKPLYFGLDFQLIPIVIMVIMFVVNSVQAIGEFTATTTGGMDRQPTDEELHGGIIGSGLASVVGAFFGAMPMATYGQNAGIVTVTKAINRTVFLIAAIIFLGAGFIPKFSAVLTTIPYAVIGGATISVFASISMTGVKIISSQRLTTRNCGVVGLALALGTGVALSTGSLAGFPDWINTVFGHSEVILTTIAAVILNLVLPKDPVPKADAESEKAI